MPQNVQAGVSSCGASECYSLPCYVQIRMVTGKQSIKPPTTAPQAFFFQKGGDVIVFGMYNSKVHTLHAKDGAFTGKLVKSESPSKVHKVSVGYVRETTLMQLGSKGTGMMIGAASIDPSCKFFIIDNATISFSLHCMGDTTCIKTYDTQLQKTYPKQVTFAERGRVIVGGSDNGIVYIFNKTTGDLLQLLQHLKSSQVQTVTKSIKPGPGNRTWAMIWTALQMVMQLLAIAIVGMILYHTMEGKVDLQYIWEFQLDENIICQVLAQELAAKLSMDDRKKILNTEIKE
ncbi:hypothetical protein J3A83DRAFT_4184646 [Scleroderma citrinum]